jgi:hypothetical protein
VECWAECWWEICAERVVLVAVIVTYLVVVLCFVSLSLLVSCYPICCNFLGVHVVGSEQYSSIHLLSSPGSLIRS